MCNNNLIFNLLAITILVLGLIISRIAIADPTAVHISVQLTGVAEHIGKTIQANLAIYQATKETKLTLVRIRNLHDRAVNQILDTLEAMGYYHTEIKATLENIPNQTNWQATYAITLGKPTTLQKISLTLLGVGKDNTELNQAIHKSLKTPKLAIGSIITQQNYEQSKQELLITAYNFGFLNAEFKHSKLKINRDTYQAEIALVLDTGKQYAFSQVNFHDSKYTTDLLQRFVPFKPGENYNIDKLNLLHKNLNEADLFSKIRIDPDPDLEDPANTQVPMDVRLVDKPLDRFTGNAGYGTDTSFRGGIGWQHRLLSPAGHRFNTGLNASGIRKQLFANYSIPGNHAATDKYIINTSISSEMVKKKFSRRNELSLVKVKKINDLQTFWTIQYLDESFKLVPNQDLDHKKYLLPSIKTSWLEAAEDTSLAYGKKLDLTARGGLNMLLSSTDLVQGEASAKWISNIFSKDTRCLARINLGYTAAKNFDNIPFSLRFFAGGDHSVRGFSYQSLGPKKINNDNSLVVVGGKHLFEASLEIDHKLYQELRGAAFIDAGNAMNTWQMNLPVGAGIGLRWATSIGMFRIDLAKQMRQIENKNLRVHLTFGTDL